MYIITSSLNININPWIKKILNHQRPYKKYWFNIVDDKKDLKIWWDGPFNYFHFTLELFATLTDVIYDTDTIYNYSYRKLMWGAADGGYEDMLETPN
jgi:hypothetical protein